MKNAVYDTIALEYKKSKELPFRQYIEAYTLFQVAGNIQGLDVIDLACGEGHYTRKLKRAGANFVGGIDISEEMIHLAEINERETPLGCHYSVHDVACMPIIGKYHLVVAMYLLNYAKSEDELLAFCRAAHQQLTSGGRFIGVNDSPFNKPSQYPTYRPYGFTKKIGWERKAGDPIYYTFFNEDGSYFRFNNYFLPPQTYESAFREAGFVNFQWRPVALDPSQAGNAFWNHFLAEPPIIGFSAEKGTNGTSRIEDRENAL